MSNTYDFDIAIIGDGITGLSAAHHLQKLGFPRLCVFGSESEKSATRGSSGLLAGGMLDNYTRLSHHYGRGLAKSIWTFADAAYDALILYCQQQKIPLQQGERYRWINSKAEAIEAHKAIMQMQEDGFAAKWLDSTATLSHPGPGFEGTQGTEARAASADVTGLMLSLRKGLASVPFKTAALRLIPEANAVLIESKQGKTRVECVICAQHLAIPQLLPELATALVPFADQWTEFELEDPKIIWPWPVGSVFSWQHGYYWGGLTHPQRLRLGGARFLRPMAGVEATSAPYEPNITQHLQSAWQLLWPELKLRTGAMGRATLDCRPCDELPIIGPMFGQSRLLVATGYMGQGLALGFMAGRCLAELIAEQPTSLPRSLWPERLRSLPSHEEGETH